MALLGMLGPLFGACISMMLLVAMLWALSFANLLLQSIFITLLIAAVERNLVWFFAFFLLASCCDFFARRSHAGYVILQPVRNAAGFAFSIWMISWVIRTFGALAGAAMLSQIGIALREGLFAIFLLVLALGYLSVAASDAAKRRF
jgi:hypothetical protein